MTTSTTTHERTEALVHSIVEGLRAKKGHDITILDLHRLHDRPTDYMIIAESNSPTGISTLEESVREVVEEQAGERPIRVHKGSGEWIAMDYVDAMVHLFTPELRSFYHIEQMWEDADMTRLEDEV
ncbi:ribosome silencing factor [uncultured Porphyromonas sp.]|uniref:ribosome silencing factor n=1 Tax=uncultured Porphyromonas sp. TaxID=159274 RepID=UPI0025D2469E|nr:ribosome silencing factor [uncultured Porphyromonas sp.]